MVILTDKGDIRDVCYCSGGDPVWSTSQTRVASMMYAAAAEDTLHGCPQGQVGIREVCYCNLRDPEWSCTQTRVTPGISDAAAEEIMHGYVEV